MEKSIRELLGSRIKKRIEPGDRIPAAVLIPLYRDGDDYHVVFIRRTDTVPTHKGQISFPGGGQDEGDADLLVTALRESYEEIGLQSRDTEVLGELDDEITTTSNYVVSPFVGLIPWPYEFTRNEREVDEILTVPLSVLLGGSARRPDTEVLNGEPLPSYAYHHNGNVIWGATARMLYKLLGILDPGTLNDGDTEEDLPEATSTPS